MAEIKIISESKLRYIAGERGFNLIYLEKDYFLTLFLYLLKDVEGLCFKGGTALNKIFLSHKRLSEDLDFVCKKDILTVKEQVIKIWKNNKNFFPKYKFENETPNFFRLKIFYNSFFSKTNYILLDVNQKASIILAPQKQKIYPFYEGIPNFEIFVLSPKELVAEKIRTLITRNQPRDYFDVYNLFEKGHKIDLKLVKKKMEEVGQEFEVKRIFKNAQKIHSRWDTEITQLTNEPVKF
nr:hypothetical protein [Nanoarchaeum sp.]